MNYTPYIKLIRPVNSIMIGFAVLVGESVASSFLPFSIFTLLGFLTGFSITAYSMVINDIFDEEVDRRNKLDRPLATGAVSSRSAKKYAIFFLLLGLTLSLLTGLLTFAIAFAFALLSTLYNWKLKESGLPGNLAVALSMTIPFIYGGLLAGKSFDLLLDSMALTAFLSGVGREVIKGISDVEGDALRNVRSIARVKGVRAASYTGALFFLLAVATSQVPTILGKVGLPYLIVIGITDIFFIFLSVWIIKNNDSARKVKTGALFGMLLGLIGFILQGLLP